MAYVVPPEYLPVIQSVAYTKGVPASWLAAVCERTGWNPNLQQFNFADPQRNSVRRFGLAGVWGDLPELPTSAPNGWFTYWCCSQLGSGWFPWALDRLIGQIWYHCACLSGHSSADPYNLAVERNLKVAADILKDCAFRVKGICGGYNELIFLRWQLGCHYYPQKNAEGQCIIPPGLPNIFKAEMQELVEAQAIYAEQFAEQPIVAPPPPPVSVSLSANALEAPPGSAITFTANVAGGVPPYHFHWSFGDTTSADTTSPVVAHAFETVGVYGVVVTCYDTAGAMANSPALGITISEEAPPPPTSKAVLWGLLGLAGLVGVVALAKKKKKSKV